VFRCSWRLSNCDTIRPKREDQDKRIHCFELPNSLLVLGRAGAHTSAVFDCRSHRGRGSCGHRGAQYAPTREKLSGRPRCWLGAFQDVGRGLRPDANVWRRGHARNAGPAIRLRGQGRIIFDDANALPKTGARPTILAVSVAPGVPSPYNNSLPTRPRVPIGSAGVQSGRVR